jgi:hypothetical protein
MQYFRAHRARSIAMAASPQAAEIALEDVG